jgi:hypothetical protein
MIYPIAQILLVTILALAFYWWRRNLKLRNEQSWEQLIARLRTDWSAHALSEHFLWRTEMKLAPEEAWSKLQGPRGLIIIYQNANVMLQIADYAVRNSSEQHPVDPMLIAALRSDAMQIRLLVIAALAQYALLRATAGVRINAQRAAAVYTDMAARMTSLLQVHAAAKLPDFVGAM